MKKYLWSKEALVSDINGEILLSNCICASILLYILLRLAVISTKLLSYVRTHVTIPTNKYNELINRLDVASFLLTAIMKNK